MEQLSVLAQRRRLDVSVLKVRYVREGQHKQTGQPRSDFWLLIDCSEKTNAVRKRNIE